MHTEFLSFSKKKREREKIPEEQITKMKSREHSAPRQDASVFIKYSHRIQCVIPLLQTTNKSIKLAASGKLENRVTKDLTSMYSRACSKDNNRNRRKKIASTEA